MFLLISKSRVYSNTLIGLNYSGQQQWFAQCCLYVLEDDLIKFKAKSASLCHSTHIAVKYIVPLSGEGETSPGGTMGLVSSLRPRGGVDCCPLSKHGAGKLTIQLPVTGFASPALPNTQCHQVTNVTHSFQSINYNHQNNVIIYTHLIGHIKSITQIVNKVPSSTTITIAKVPSRLLTAPIN